MSDEEKKSRIPETPASDAPAEKASKDDTAKGAAPKGEPKAGKKDGGKKDGGKKKTAADASDSADAPEAPRAPHVPGKRAHPVPRLEQRFRDEVVPAVMEEFKFTNVHQVPVLSKIMVNTGVGKQLENQKLKPEYRDAVIDTYLKITGQKPVMVKARKSVANFKVREGAPSAFMVTLRGDRMWHFLDRLINLAIPRIKDFRGVSDKAFDKGGSWAFGLSEQAVWPEINMASVTHSHGMNINLVFENSTPAVSRFMLDRLGMPFVRPEASNRRQAEPVTA